MEFTLSDYDMKVSFALSAILQPTFVKRDLLSGNLWSLDSLRHYNLWGFTINDFKGT